MNRKQQISYKTKYSLPKKSLIRNQF